MSNISIRLYVIIFNVYKTFERFIKIEILIYQINKQYFLLKRTSIMSNISSRLLHTQQIFYSKFLYLTAGYSVFCSFEMLKAVLYI